jgi:endonuclease YncB( thermonuclease family)
MALPLQADIYRSEDSRGRVVFSDRPDQAAEKVELQTQPYRYRVTVKRVIDGDTIELQDGEKVRLLGINTPEISSRYSNAEPGGEAAKDWLQRRLQSGSLYLEYDSEQRDKYDRQLAHCFLEEGEYVNAALLEAGLAMLTITPPNLRYAAQLQQAQNRAEKAQRGVWVMPDYQPRQLAALEPGKNYRGWQRWQVTPREIREGRRYLNLVVSEHFLIRIPNDQLSLFPPVESYLDSGIEVRGWLSRRKDLYSILVQHPSAILHP